jgi:hypothetical protein
VETLADLSKIRTQIMGETEAKPLDIRPDFDPIAALREQRPVAGRKAALPIRPVTVAFKAPDRARILAAATPVLADLEWRMADVPAPYRELHDRRPYAWLVPSWEGRLRLPFRRRRAALAAWQPHKEKAVALWRAAGCPGRRAAINII